MMKAFRAWGPVALVFTALMAGTAQAQDIKIGVVNFPLLAQQSPQYEAMAAALETEFAPRQREIMTMQQDLEQKNQTLQRDASVMSEEERTNLERELRDGSRALQRAVTDANEDFNARQNEELANVNRELLQQIQAYAREEDYDLIIGEAIYYDSDLDITEEVLGVLRDD